MKSLADSESAKTPVLIAGRSLLSEAEVEASYGFTRAWLRRCRLERRGPRFLRLSRMVRYRREDIEAYLAQHAVETSEKD
jgi:predicted DNA-binding transcriptional regulator AlpA